MFVEIVIIITLSGNIIENYKIVRSPTFTEMREINHNFLQKVIKKKKAVDFN